MSTNAIATDTMNPVEAKEWIGIALTALTLLTLAATTIGKARRAAVNGARWAADWIAAPARISRDVAMIRDQVFPNGGSSMRDAICRLERAVSEVRNGQIENAQTLRHIVVNSDTGFWESDGNGECLDINAAILKRVGFTKEQALGNGWVNFIWPPHREKVFKEWNDACEQKRDFGLEYSYISQDGKEIPLTAHGFLIHNQHGEVSKFIGLVKFKHV